LRTRLCRSPTVSELAREAGVRESDVAEAVRSERARVPTSLSSAGDGPDVLDHLGRLAPDVDLSDDRLLLEVGFRVLGERERRILHLRYYEDLSQAEIAREVGLSQIQVSRLIRKSLERMRGALESSAGGSTVRQAPPRA
jgi:RNA polymerase sigma-B factor